MGRNKNINPLIMISIENRFIGCQTRYFKLSLNSMSEMDIHVNLNLRLNDSISELVIWISVSKTKKTLFKCVHMAKKIPFVCPLQKLYLKIENTSWARPFDWNNYDSLSQLNVLFYFLLLLLPFRMKLPEHCAQVNKRNDYLFHGM